MSSMVVLGQLRSNSAPDVLSQCSVSCTRSPAQASHPGRAATRQAERPFTSLICRWRSAQRGAL